MTHNKPSKLTSDAAYERVRMQIATAIELLMKEQRVSLAALARGFRIGQAAMRRKIKCNNISLRELVKLCDYLDCDPYAILRPRKSNPIGEKR